MAIRRKSKHSARKGQAASAKKSRVVKRQNSSTDVKKLSKKIERQRKAVDKLTARQRKATKDLQRDIAKLRKLGLYQVKGATASLKPTDYRRKIVRQFKYVLNGALKPLRVSKTEAKRLKRVGYRVKGRTILVQEVPGKKISVDKSGHLKIQEGKRITRLVIPEPIQTLAEYLDDPALPKLGKNEWFVFRIYGNESYGRFSTKEQLLNNIMHYKTIQGYQTTGDTSKLDEFYSHIELFRINEESGKLWGAIRDKSPRKKRARRRDKRSRVRGR